ncbi:MAG: chemotaxis protein CheW [Anaerolineae bacterium]|nr:chemotaxis protein CheW [Anaerolineae bacterium]
MTTKDQLSEEQLVVFELAGESYGVEISRVQEIDRMQQITVVPRTPAFVEGVINLRGRITPVVDTRTRFGLPKAEVTPLTRIVVVKAGEEWVGLVVDAVSEVLRIPVDSIEPPSAMVTTADSAYLRGIAKLDQRLIILLDLDRVLDKEFQITAMAVA